MRYFLTVYVLKMVFCIWGSRVCNAALPPSLVLALTEISLAGETDNQGLYLLSGINRDVRLDHRSSWQD